jgi:hypothetical protein
MKTNSLPFILSIILLIFFSSDINSQIITRTYNASVGGSYSPVYNVDVDLDGTDDYSFVHHSGIVSSDWYCQYSYIRPLHSNALVGTFNSASMLTKVFDDGVLIDDLAATYDYDTDTNAYQVKEQYLFTPGSGGYTHYGFIAFKLHGKFGYFSTGHNKSSFCNNNGTDRFLGLRVDYARYENTMGTPITINATLGLKDDAEAINLNIYPSPFTNSITIKGVEGQIAVKLYNSLGEVTGNWIITETNNTITPENLPSGVYFLYIQTASGATTKKIIKN